MLGNFQAFVTSLLTPQSYPFQEILSGTPSECQIVWIQIVTDVKSVLIWARTVCKGYQQLTKMAGNKERVKLNIST